MTEAKPQMGQCGCSGSTTSGNVSMPSHLPPTGVSGPAGSDVPAPAAAGMGDAAPMLPVVAGATTGVSAGRTTNESQPSGLLARTATPGWALMA